jgi:ABC-type Na+ efflux pump permease subunit
MDWVRVRAAWYAAMEQMDTMNDERFLALLVIVFVLLPLFIWTITTMVKTKDWPSKWFVADGRPRYGDNFGNRPRR